MKRMDWKFLWTAAIRKGIAFLVLLPAAATLSAQDTTASVLTLQEFLSGVAAYSPIARNAGLQQEQAQGVLQMARGAFDPKLYADWQQKSFDGKSYYTLGSAGVKVQSPFALSFKSEFNTARGAFLNPEDKLPAAGQALLGVNLPLLNGLFIDPYRAELQQARLGLPVARATRQSQLNDLLFEAGLAFIDWSVAWAQVSIYQQAADIARFRLGGVVESFLQGDKPAVDTLETYILLQNRLFDLNEARLATNVAAQALDAFFWSPTRSAPPTTPLSGGRRPAVFADTSAPVLPLLDSFLTELPARHPDLRLLDLELQQLAIDRRLAAEQLKPRLDLSYNLLGNGTDFTSGNGAGNLLQDVLLQNYKWGLNFSFPLFLRKERGKLALTTLKQETTTNKLQQKQADLEVKVRNYFSELQNSASQIALYRSISDNYQRLLDAERVKFDLGESSVFLLNTREQKLLEAQVKYAKLQGLYQKHLLALSWAAGKLGGE